MNFKRLFTDDDAVSPVIGVILMVAITVILAAVIGAFVLGFGSGGDSAPQANWETSESYNDSGGSVGEIVFETSSVSDNIDAEDLVISAPGHDDQDVGSGSISAGSSITVDVDNSTNPEIGLGDEVDLVWTGDGSSIIATHEWGESDMVGIDDVNLD